MEEARTDGASFSFAGCIVDAAAMRVDTESFSLTLPASPILTWSDILHNVRYETVLIAEDFAITVHWFEDAAAAQAQWPTKNAGVSLEDTIGELCSRKSLWLVLSIEKPEVLEPFYFSARELTRVPTTFLPQDIPRNSHVGLKIAPPIASWEDTFSKMLCFRREDICVLSLLTDHAMAGKDAPPKILHGSPGCGRSSLAQVLALLLSHEHEKDVLYMHQVKPTLIMVHFFSKAMTLVSGVAQDYSVASLVQLLSVIEGRLLGPFVIVDGFDQKELAWLAKHDLLISSEECSKDSSGILASSWSVDQVLQLHPHATDLPPTVLRERYARYGGDLASIFSRDQESTARALRERIDRVLHAKTGTLQRYRVIDPTKDDHFTCSRRWKGQSESFEVLRARINEMSIEWFEILLDRASVTPLYEDAYELTCQAWAMKGKKVRLGSLTCTRWMESPSAVEDRTPSPAWGRMLQVGRITLDTSVSIFEGNTEDTAYAAMRNVARGRATYWGPAYSAFPAVDAVARCTLQFKNNSPTTEAVALLRYTVGERKDPSVDMISRVKRIVARYTKLPIVFIFVSPPGIDMVANGVPSSIPTFSAKFECQSAFFSHSPKYTREVIHILGEPI